jgi:ESCRT-II complex subunit VPS22
LAPLGPGVSVVTLRSGARYIRSIPKELNPDQAVVLEVAGVMGGCVSVGLLKVNLAWEEERGKSVMEELVAEGMVWVDDGGNEREYWIPRGITEL